MEDEYQEIPGWKSWVKDAKFVTLHTEKHCFRYGSIADTMTILDIKKLLHNLYNIPVDNQSIKAFRSFSIGALHLLGWPLSEPLKDNERVKDVMNEFNTQHLALYLQCHAE